MHNLCYIICYLIIKEIIRHCSICIKNKNALMKKLKHIQIKAFYKRLRKKLQYYKDFKSKMFFADDHWT